MKSALSVLGVLLLASACSTNMSSSGPAVSVKLAQRNASSNIFYFAGPVNLEYLVQITNPTNEPVTMTSLDLQTVGPGAYFVRAGGTPMNLTVPASSARTYTIAVWGRARGGYISSTEPVTLRGIAHFKGQTSGAFTRIFTENVTPAP